VLSNMSNAITAAVIQRRFFAISDEMGEAMLRTAYSQILNASRDFSIGMFDAAGRLIGQAEHIPLHVGGLPFAMQAVTDYFGDDIHDGDVILLNDPYHGGNHLPDLTCFVPVFLDGYDKPQFWTLNRAHQSDIGGSAAGSYNPAATEIWQEGLRIPPLKLIERGKERSDVLAMIAANVRHGPDFRGDLAAMIGSARIGASRLKALVSEYGLDVVRMAIDHILNSAEVQAREAIKSWADGNYTGTAFMDDDGHGATDIAIRASVTISGSDLIVDLTESDAQVKGFNNSSYANTVSSVHYALAYLIDPSIPKNSGTFRSVKVLTKPGTVVHPKDGAAVTLSTNHPSQEIAEAVMIALAPACPERVVAGWGKRYRIAISGENPRTQKPFIWHLFHARPGAGASANGDGWSNIGELANGGGLKFGPIEVMETRFPLFFERHEFRAGSAGAGKYRGGYGVSLALRIETEKEVSAVAAGEGKVHAPFGLFGGEDGLPHSYKHMPWGTSDLIDIPTKTVNLCFGPRDLLLIESAGGGGYGDVAERPKKLTVLDMKSGLENPVRGPGV